MNPTIYIDLFRVSADGKFLEAVFDCPYGYQFTKFLVTANYRTANASGSMVQNEEVFDIGDGIFNELDEVKNDGTYKYRLSRKTHWVVRIPIEEELDIHVPAIYTGVLSAQQVKRISPHHIWEEEDHVDDWNPRVIGEEDLVHEIMHEVAGSTNLPDATAICSDVSNVYNNILDEVINSTGVCDKVSDQAIRNYLILFAHQEALRLGHKEDAILYFNMINNNFNRCGTFARQGSGPKCGCQSNAGASVSRPSVSSRGASCGCGK